MVSKIFNIIKKFAINKNWKDCFFTVNKLYICYLTQNFFLFEIFNKIGKVLISNIKKNFKSNNANISLIIIFNKVTNLFTLKIVIFGTTNFDISYYIVLNYILNYLKKKFI